ncbi:hypothetical protein RO3G_16070 [Lichtheimia corymbifera JMRC:FSU:9682]|uniref:BHLH domain-containing protein n=1 Tax=Lichtheimia corymbifera JMRC:FSU:9682 TaxID=1263082 RepID=A0A068SBD8_9FUNG|nr:hypothetical protein RO3G_16070 [Lichtheimia corymbifera JMRC:FSU:9682]
MYSPTQPSYGLEGPSDSSTSPVAHHQQEHPFVPTPSSSNSRRSSSSRLFNQQSPPIPHPSSSYQLYQRHQEHSFGAAAASMALSPSGGRPIPFADAHTQHHWLGTSLDSATPASPTPFGQSPLFQGHDLVASTSTGHIDGSGGFTTGEEDEVQQRNLQEMFEKRRRRRESHNAVERRRRDNINEKIQELGSLLPDHLIDAVPPTANVMTASLQQGNNSNPAARTINKGTILKLSVDHIKELQSELSRYKDRINQLEYMIKDMKHHSSSGDVIEHQ